MTDAARGTKVTYNPAQVADVDAVAQAFAGVLSQLGYTSRMMITRTPLGQKVCTVAVELSDPPVTVNPEERSQR